MEDEARWAALQDGLRTRWPQLSQKRRVAIHVPSLSFDEAQRAQGSMGHFATRQNLQMSRLCSVADPLVDIDAAL